MRNLGEMYNIDELKNGNNLDVLNDIVDVALDKDENPDKYPVKIFLEIISLQISSRNV